MNLEGAGCRQARHQQTNFESSRTDDGRRSAHPRGRLQPLSLDLAVGCRGEGTTGLVCAMVMVKLPRKAISLNRACADAACLWSCLWSCFNAVPDTRLDFETGQVISKVTEEILVMSWMTWIHPDLTQNGFRIMSFGLPCVDN